MANYVAMTRAIVTSLPRVYLRLEMVVVAICRVRLHGLRCTLSVHSQPAQAVRENGWIPSRRTHQVLRQHTSEGTYLRGLVLVSSGVSGP